MSPLCCLCVLTERADIVELRSEPFFPIADSSPEEVCLPAGEGVEIVCAHISYPVATVKFMKDGSDIVLNER